MGWDIFSDPKHGKAYVVKELLRGFSGERAQYRVLDHAVAGGELWRVVEVTEDGKVSRMIWRDLIRSGGRGSGWGYKQVPHYEGLSCPKRLLDMVLPDGSERDEVWRIQCAEERHAKAQRAKALKQLVPGAKVSIYGKVYEILRKHTGRGWIVRQDENGQIYRAISNIQPL